MPMSRTPLSPMPSRLRLWLGLLLALTAGAFLLIGGPQQAASDSDDAASATCGGLILPPGFCATVFADNIGHARHLVVAHDGVVYVNTWSGRYYGSDTTPPGGFLVALKDTNGDGAADLTERFGETEADGSAGGTGIALYKGALYAEMNDRILRFPLKEGEIAPSAAPEVVVSDLPLTGDHPMHPFAIDADGGLYVDLGSATNSCQVKNRMPSSPGHQPCTELETRGGIWRYDANKTDQKFSPAERYATGIRNADGIAVDATGHGVYATQHGRDQLSQNWPKLYTTEQGANLPAEELLRVEQGADYGWPQCYYDGMQAKLVLAPEYGGDGGKAVGVCATKHGPVAAFPAHWAPNDLALYDGRQFPAAYRGGAFIAFHGSWNRAPLPQGGYNVVFRPLKDGNASGKYVVFADGFAGGKKEPGEAAHRPSGVAVGPDGALYISDDQHGRIWKVTYHGKADEGVTPASASSGEQHSDASASAGEPGPPEGIHPDAGHPAAAIPAGATPDEVALGAKIFDGKIAGAACEGCHGSDAKGTPLGPNLTDGKWLWGDGSLAAITKTIETGVPNPKQYNGVMPPMGGAQLSPEQLKAVASYVWSLSHHKDACSAC
jgi:glucose/arabinose dehydrogenase/mono/diheme cytochrome c family protein